MSSTYLYSNIVLHVNHNCLTLEVTQITQITGDEMCTKIECLPTLHIKGQIYIALEASLNQSVYKKTHSKALKGK